MKFVLTCVALIIGFLILIRILENKFIFFPEIQQSNYWLPQSLEFEISDCFFEAADGTKLHGWFVRNDSARFTLLWCHGNAGNIYHRLDNIARLARLPINIFIFDFRGYGKSAGTANEAGIYADAHAAYDFLQQQKKIKAENIIIFGRSLGGAVAVELAAHKPCAKLVLESTFTNAGAMAKTMFGVIPVQLVMKSRFNSAAKIKQINVPILFIHGNNDHVVPYELGKQLFETANEPKEFYTIDGADHNDTYFVGGDAYFNRLEKFILRL